MYAFENEPVVRSSISSCYDRYTIWQILMVAVDSVNENSILRNPINRNKKYL